MNHDSGIILTMIRSLKHTRANNKADPYGRSH